MLVKDLSPEVYEHLILKKIPADTFAKLLNENRQKDDEINRARHAWFGTLLAYYPHQDEQAYNDFKDKIETNAAKDIDYEDIRKLALADERLLEKTFWENLLEKIYKFSCN